MKKKKVYRVLLIAVLAVVALAVVLFAMQRKKAAENAHLTPTERIEALLTEHAKKTKTLQFAMNVPASGIHYSFSSTVPKRLVVAKISGSASGERRIILA